jgi:hypothetical protein
MGVRDDTFSPDVPTKREEAAAIVWRYLKAHNVRPSVQNFMLPNTVDGWASVGVAQSIAKKLWGIPFKTGNYQDTASRQEAVALIDLAGKQETKN